MMKRIIALISIVLSFCTLVTAIPITSFASESDDKYKEAVVEQYKDSFSDNDYYSRLVSEGYTYYYKIWASNIDDKGALTKGYLWCVNKIMGTELDTLAYVEYLTKLMEMFDQSYVDFIANQSQWTKKLTIEDYADEAGKIAVKAFVGVAGFDEIEKAFAFLGATKDLTDVADKLLEDEKEIAVLSVATTNYQKKRTVLQAIYDNAEDEHLKEAAQIKMYECDMKYIYVADECLTDITTAVAKLGDEVFELKVLEHIADSVAEGFADWAKEYAGETIGGAMSIVVTFCAVNIGYIAIGAEIGIAISKMTMGNKYETFREAMAMDRISTALSKALKKLKSSADSTGEYETIRDYVYIGGALIYVHLRGEYCDANQRIGNDEITAAKAAYNTTASHMSECTEILSEILVYEDDIDISRIFASNNDGGKFYSSSSGRMTTDGSYIYYYDSDLKGYCRVSCSGGATEFIGGTIEIQKNETWIGQASNIQIHGGYIYGIVTGPKYERICRIDIATGEYEFIYSALQHFTTGTGMSKRFFSGIDEITDMLIIGDTLYFAFVAYPFSSDDYPTAEIGRIDLNNISEPEILRVVEDCDSDGYRLITDYENLYMYTGGSWADFHVISLDSFEVQEEAISLHNYSYQSIIFGIDGFGYMSERLEGDNDYVFTVLTYDQLFEESDEVIVGIEVAGVDETFYDEHFMSKEKYIMGNNCFVVEGDQLIVYKNMDFTNPQTLVSGFDRGVRYGNTIYDLKWNESGEGKIIIVDSRANIITYVIR